MLRKERRGRLPTQIVTPFEETEEEVQLLKRNRSTMPVPITVPEGTSLELSSSSPSVLPAAPSPSPALPQTKAATSSVRSQERCPDLQRPSLD